MLFAKHYFMNLQISLFLKKWFEAGYPNIFKVIYLCIKVWVIDVFLSLEHIQQGLCPKEVISAVMKRINFTLGMYAGSNLIIYTLVPFLAWPLNGYMNI